MDSQSWMHLAVTYVCCWGMGRIFISAEEREQMGTRTLTDKMKLILFLLPKTKLQTFTLYSIIYMAVINVILSVQLALAAVNFFAPGSNIVSCIDWLSIIMLIILFAYICIAVSSSMVNSFKQWRQKRKLREEIKQKGGLFFEKDDSIEVPERFVFKAPKEALYLGLASILIWMAVIILITVFPNDTVDWTVYAMFSILLVLGAWLAYYAIRWRVTVEHDSIRLTPLIGKEKTYSIHEITSAVFKDRTSILVVYKDSKKIFDLAPYYVGFFTFAAYLQNADIQIEIKV